MVPSRRRPGRRPWLHDVGDPQPDPNLVHSTQFTYFFASRRRAKPAVDQPAPGGRLSGWLEWTRAEAFQTLSPFDQTLRKGEPWSSLQAKVFVVAQRSLSAVLAVYGPSEILWLDDHTDEADFSEFVRREALLGWLPERGVEFARLLCDTRMNYLGSPALVQSTMDVPAYSESDKADYQGAGMDETLAIVLDSERRLAELADHLRPVAVTSGKDGAAHLDCNLWTRIMGRLIHLALDLETDGGCRFAGEELARFVGKGYVPR